MKKVYKKSCQSNGNSCWTSINSYPCFQLQVGGLCFGIPSLTCFLHMLPSNFLRLLKYIWAGLSDWLTHEMWWQANVGKAKWLSFTTGVSVYLL